ncbi:hypothetical protein H7J93_03050 [Mycobacterium barrassiae]|nr:hypothetical protein [Mycobacterium barrassiae]MCV7298612.1 hypothetical protein [Mycobacterium barrassiae]
MTLQLIFAGRVDVPGVHVGDVFWYPLKSQSGPLAKGADSISAPPA